MMKELFKAGGRGWADSTPYEWRVTKYSAEDIVKEASDVDINDTFTLYSYGETTYLSYKQLKELVGPINEFLEAFEKAERL